MPNNDFSRLITGKKVIVIGPANYLKDNKISDKIDYFDTVIRVNSSIDISEKIPEIVGNRTDVVYTTCDIDHSNNTNNRKIDLWIKNKVRHVRISPPAINLSFKSNILSFIRENNERLNYSIIEVEKYRNHMRGCSDTIPNTGFEAILDCLDHSPSELHISGITFFKGGYLDEYEGKVKTEQEVGEFFKRVNSHHNIDKQIKFFKEIFYNYKNITCDAYIVEVLGL
jgi:hypothetical protein